MVRYKDRAMKINPKLVCQRATVKRHTGFLVYDTETRKVIGAARSSVAAWRRACIDLRKA